MTDPGAALEAVGSALREHIAVLRGELDDVLGSASSTTGDDDPEGATIGYERAWTQALLDGAQAQLFDVGAAQARVERGTYGVCTACAQPIGAQRLAARPATDRCMRCAVADLSCAERPTAHPPNLVPHPDRHRRSQVSARIG